MVAFATLALASLPSAAIRLSDGRYEKVVDVMHAITGKSWENGTLSQAILESQYESLNVFSPTTPFPIPNPLPSGDISQIIELAQVTLQNRPAPSAGGNASGASLLEDGAAADPASLGIAVMLANASTGNAQVNGVGYGDAAEAELRYLLDDVPRSSSGAISHRADQSQYWADFVYMVPPFLAYYGVVHNNETLVREAVNQCGLYRSALRQSNGLWAHILQGTGAHDPGLWATGNAWAAQGMLRVWATIYWSQYASGMQSQLNDLETWVQEIVSASQGVMTSNNLLHNYMDQANTFEDSAASALMAAAALRLSTLNITDQYVPMGINLLSAVSAKVNSTGYVTQVVNPYDFTTQGAESSEAQSFVVMAYAAYNQWEKQGSPNKPSGNNDPLGDESAAMARLGGVSSLLLGGLAVLLWSTL